MMTMHGTSQNDTLILTLLLPSAVPAGTHCYLYGNELNSTDLGPCPSVKALVGGYDVDVNADQCSTVPERARDIVGEVASIFGDSETENVLSLIASSTDSHYGSYPAYPTDDTISVGDLDNFKEELQRKIKSSPSPLSKPTHRKFVSLRTPMNAV